MNTLQTYLSYLLDVALEAAPWLALGLIAAGLLKGLLPSGALARFVGKPGLSSIIRGALIGVPLPLCSCGVVPAALGLRREGASKGSTVSFLVATPQTGVDSLAVSYALLGPLITIARPIASVVTAIAGGLAAEAVDGNETPAKAATTSEGGCCCGSKPEPKVSSCCGDEKKQETKTSACCSTETQSQTASCCSSEPKPEPVSSCCGGETKAEASSCCGSEKKTETKSSCCSSEQTTGETTFLNKFWGGQKYAWTTILDDMAVWLIIGLLIAALINTFAPPSALAGIGSGLPAMIAMVVIGIPMYICATASTPVAASLLVAGVSPGTVLVFLLAGPATNAGTVALIRRELGTAPTAAYLAAIVVVSIIAGLITDVALSAAGWTAPETLHHHANPAWTMISWAALILLIVLGMRKWVIPSRVMAQPAAS